MNYKSFTEMLRESKKYKDLITTFEGLLSLTLALILSFIISSIFGVNKQEVDYQKYNEFMKNISSMFISGLIGLLGFIIAGLTFSSGSVSLRATKKLLTNKKIDCLISIFFTFYFLGALVGVDIILFLLVYIISFSSQDIIYWVHYLLLFVISYLTLFILFYSIGLLESCINIFFINYNFNKDE